jgi:hypothetical protein
MAPAELLREVRPAPGRMRISGRCRVVRPVPQCCRRRVTDAGGGHPSYRRRNGHPDLPKPEWPPEDPASAAARGGDNISRELGAPDWPLAAKEDGKSAGLRRIAPGSLGALRSGLS